jgi:hypothetical protein
VQLFFNAAVVLLVLYVLWQFGRTVSRDVDLKAEEYSMGARVPAHAREFVID